jgi:O-acetyl-ADP-ribose deacetylase (regulator of RNase III)
MAIQLLYGDITKMKVDAIVNAANTHLRGGGGVDGAIHRAGGPVIMEECRKIGYCPVGEAVITSAGNLPCKYVIHTVGPVWHGGGRDEEKKLANCYLNSLKLAGTYGLKTIAFPNISTGVYGYPNEAAARVATETVKKVLESHPEFTVLFVCFDEKNHNIYERILGETGH